MDAGFGIGAQELVVLTLVGALLAGVAIFIYRATRPAPRDSD